MIWRKKYTSIKTYSNHKLLCSCVTLLLFINLTTAQFWSTYSIPRWLRTQQESPVCPEPNGQFNHPRYCDLFLNCWNGRATIGHCGYSLVFNERIRACDYPSNVDCTGKENSNRPGVVPNPQVVNNKPQKPARPANENSNFPELIIATTTTTQPTTTSTTTEQTTTTERITITPSSTTSTTKGTTTTPSTTEQTTTTPSTITTEQTTTTPSTTTEQTTNSSTTTPFSTTPEQLISATESTSSTETSSTNGASEISPTSSVIPILIPGVTEPSSGQTRPPPPTDPRCREPVGLFANPFNCTEYFICYGGGISIHTCPEGKYFDSDYRECKDKTTESCKNDEIGLSRPVPAGTPTIRPTGTNNNSSATESTPTTTDSSTAQSTAPQEELPLKPKPQIVSSTPTSNADCTPQSSAPQEELPLKPKPQIDPSTPSNNADSNPPYPGLRPKPLLVPGKENSQPAQDIFPGVKPKPLLVPGDAATDKEENKPTAPEIKPKPQLNPETESTTESENVLPGVKPKPQINPGDSESNLPEDETATESNNVLPGVKPKPQLNPGDPTTSKPGISLPDLPATPSENATGFRPKPPLFNPTPSEKPDEEGSSTPTTIGTLQPKPPLTPADINEEDDNRPPQLPAGIIDLTPPTTVESPSPRPPPLNPESFKPAKPSGPGAPATSSPLFPTSTKEPVDGIDDPNILFPFIPTYPHSFKCPIPIGLFPVLGDCESVIVCIAGEGHLLRCPEGEYFDFIQGKCSTERNFICSKTNKHKSKNSVQSQSVIDPITGKYISVLYAYLPLSYVQSLKKFRNTNTNTNNPQVVPYNNFYNNN